MGCTDEEAKQDVIATGSRSETGFRDRVRVCAASISHSAIRDLVLIDGL